MTDLLQLTPEKVDLFLFLQRHCFQSSAPISTLSDLLGYMRLHRKNPRTWRTLVSYWEEAMAIVVDRANAIDAAERAILLAELGATGSGVHSDHGLPPSSSSGAGAGAGAEEGDDAASASASAAAASDRNKYSFRFADLLGGAEELRRKKLKLSFFLERVDGQASINQLLRHVSQFLHRFASQGADLGLSSASSHSSSSSSSGAGAGAGAGAGGGGGSAGAGAVKEARMMVLLERIQNNYELGLSFIRLVSRNLDWAQLSIAASLRSGQGGVCKAEIRNLFSQFPVLLDTIFSKDKSLGYSSVVPFLVTVKPKTSGDLEVEMLAASSEAVRASRAPSVADDGQSLSPTGLGVGAGAGLVRPAPSTPPLPPPYSSSPSASASPSSLAASASAAAGATVAGGATAGGGASFQPTPSPPSTNPNPFAHPAYRASGQGLCPDSPYTPVSAYMKQHAALAVGGAAARAGQAGQAGPGAGGASSSHFSLQPAPASASASGAQQGGGAANTHGGSALAGPPNGLLAQANLAHSSTGLPLLNTHGPTSRPQPLPINHPLSSPISPGDQRVLYDLLVMLLTVSRPHVSLCVDSPVSLKAGAELFSVLVGPRDHAKRMTDDGSSNGNNGSSGNSNSTSNSTRSTSVSSSGSERRLPFGAPDMMRQALEREEGAASAALAPLFDTNSASTPTLSPPLGPQQEEEGGLGRPHSSSSSSAPAGDGCSVFLQTAPGIKFLAQVPKVLATVHMPALLDFLNNHFSDLAVLQEYLQNTLGGVFLIDHLEVGRIVLERVAKYLLLPGLEVDVNVQLKITAMNSELLVRILTPEIELDEHGNEVACGSSAGIGAGLGGADGSSGEQDQAESSSVPAPPPSRPYAVKFNAYVSMLDLIEDSRDIDRKLKESLQRAAYQTLGGQAGAFD